jgi:hypothetical protein
MPSPGSPRQVYSHERLDCNHHCSNPHSTNKISPDLGAKPPSPPVPYPPCITHTAKLQGRPACRGDSWQVHHLHTWPLPASATWCVAPYHYLLQLHGMSCQSAGCSGCHSSNTTECTTTTLQPPCYNHHATTTTLQPPRYNHHHATTTTTLQPPPRYNNHHATTTTLQPPCQRNTN